MVDLDNYYYIKESYIHELTDNDPLSAFALLKRASAEKEYLDTQLAELNKILFDTEKAAKGVEARVANSFRQDGKGVGDAEKLATYHHDTTSSWSEYSSIRKVRDELSAMSHFLERVYFDCKLIHEIGVRNFDKRQKYS